MPPKPITMATESIKAAATDAVRRGACNRLSAASAPSMGRMRTRMGRSKRTTALDSSGVRKIKARAAST